MAEMDTYVLFMVHAVTDDTDDNDTLIFYSIEGAHCLILTLKTRLVLTSANVFRVSTTACTKPLIADFTLFAKPMHYLCSRCKGCLIFMGV